MALLKLICNTGAKLFVDQEFVSELQENKLCITELSAGMYLVDVVSLIDDQIKVSFELSFENDNQQILKRIDLAEEEKKCKQQELKSELIRNPNLSFYRNLARFEYKGLWGYVDNNYEIVVDPIYSSVEDFVNDFALVGKSFSEGMKYALIDTTGKNRMGVWFDELIFRNEKRLFVRRNNDLLSYDVLEGTLFTYNLVGEIKDDDLIPVLWENNYSKKGGYINRHGEVVLPFIYDQISNFNEDGLAEVERFGFRRFINRKGEICLYNTIYDIKREDNNNTDSLEYTLDKEFDWCGPLESSHNDSLFLQGVMRLAVKKGEKWGYYIFNRSDYKNYLKELIQCKYDAPLSDSRYNFVIMRDGKDCCVVNLLDIHHKGGEKDGQSVYGPVGAEMFRIEADMINPLVETESHWINDDLNVDGGYWLSLFFVNMIIVKRNGKFGVVEKNSRKYLLQCEYDDIFYLGKDRVKSYDFYKAWNLIVQKNSRQEIFDYKGNITALNAVDIYPTGDFWAVKIYNNPEYYHLFSKDNGFLNVTFDEIKPINDNPFDEFIDYSFYKIKKNNKYGYLNGKAEVLLEPNYDEIFETGLYFISGFIVCKENKWGFFDNKGKQLLACVYEKIDNLKDENRDWDKDVFFVMKDGKNALYIDGYLTDFKYDNVTIECITIYTGASYDEFGTPFYLLSLDDKKYCLLDDNGGLLLDGLHDFIDVSNYTIGENKISVPVRDGMNWEWKSSRY